MLRGFTRETLVVPESNKVIQQIISAKDGICYTASDGVDCRLYKIQADGPKTAIEIQLPRQGWASFYGLEEQSMGDLRMPGVLVSLKSWTVAEAYYRYHGYNDPRVDVWMSAKTAARFQADTSSGKPVLLDIDYGSGHGIGNTRAQQIRRSTDILAFMLWQFGDPEFQPARPK